MVILLCCLHPSQLLCIQSVQHLFYSQSLLEVWISGRKLKSSLTVQALDRTAELQNVTHFTPSDLCCSLLQSTDQPAEISCSLVIGTATFWTFCTHMFGWGYWVNNSWWQQMIISVLTEIKLRQGWKGHILGNFCHNSPLFFSFSRLEQNVIKSVPAGAFSAYKKLKRM